MMVHNRYCSGPLWKSSLKDMISSQSPFNFPTRRGKAERPSEEGLSFVAMQAE
jgi:hypothetical protein